MSRSALKTIFAFSLVIEFIAIYLIYITLPTEPGFVPTILSYCAGIITTFCVTFSYKKVAIEEGFKINVPLVLGVVFGIEFVLILIRIIILFA